MVYDIQYTEGPGSRDETAEISVRDGMGRWARVATVRVRIADTLEAEVDVWFTSTLVLGLNHDGLVCLHSALGEVVKRMQCARLEALADRRSAGNPDAASVRETLGTAKQRQAQGKPGIRFVDNLPE